MFKALRSFKVADGPGKVRMVKAGDAVPEAKDWKNLSAYIQRRWITDVDEKMWDGRHMVTVAVEKTNRAKAGRAEKPVPPPPPAPEKDKKDKDEEFRAPGEYMESELEKLKKNELVAIAEHFGVEAYGNKGELIESILGAE